LHIAEIAHYYNGGDEYYEKYQNHPYGFHNKSYRSPLKSLNHIDVRLEASINKKYFSAEDV
jgi:hypothetical protein